MTVRTLTSDDQIALLVIARDDVVEAAQFLRNVGNVYANRQAARLEMVAIHVDDVLTNLRMARRDVDA